MLHKEHYSLISQELLTEKRPATFLLENVRNLLSHDKGKTFTVIQEVLKEKLGYQIFYNVVDSRAWVPQMRKRVLIAGFDIDRFQNKIEFFNFDDLESNQKNTCMKDILHLKMVPKNLNLITQMDR